MKVFHRERFALYGNTRYVINVHNNISLTFSKAGTSTGIYYRHNIIETTSHWLRETTHNIAMVYTGEAPGQYWHDM